MRRIHGLLLSSACVGSACGAETEQIEGYADFHFENDAAILCEGTRAHLQTYIERSFEFFETPIPRGFHVPIYVVDDAPCPSAACYVSSENRVYIEDLVGVGFRVAATLRHEVTHAVIDRVWGESAPFFEEGLAESLTWHLSGSWAKPPPLVPVGDLLDVTAFDLDYTAAARFIRFLIDTRGLEAFKELFQGAGGRSKEEIMDLVGEVYGESFAALEAEFLSGPPRCTFQVDICDLEVAEPVGAAWSHSFAASCDDPEFYGSVGPDSTQIATQRTLEIEVAGTYHLVSDAHLFLARCGGCDVQRVREYRYGVDADIELAAGFYTLELVAEGDGVLEVELVAR